MMADATRATGRSSDPVAARSRPARLWGARYRSAPRGGGGRWQTERRRAVTRLAALEVSILRAAAIHGCVLGA